MSNKAQTLADEALDIFETLRAQMGRITTEIKANDYGDSGDTAIEAVKKVNTLLLRAYIDFEDAYGDIEDLELAP